MGEFLYDLMFLRKLKIPFNGFWKLISFFINKQIYLQGELCYKILILNRFF